MTLGFALFASTALAHKPLCVTPNAPAIITDGTVSHAVYGRLTRRGERRSVNVHLTAGQTLAVELLLPDKPPEKATKPRALPHLTIVSFTGHRTLPNQLRERVSESITGTSYIRIAASRATVSGGDYRLIVTGAARSRFTVVVGEREEFTPADLAALPASTARVRAWYRVP